MFRLSELEAKEHKIRQGSVAGWGCLLALLILFPACGVGFLIAALILPETGAPRKDSLILISNAVLAFALISSIFVGFYGAWLIKLLRLRNVRNQLMTERRRIEAEANLKRLGQEACGHLTNLESTIQGLVEKLGIPLPYDHPTKHFKEVQSVIDAYGIRLLTDTSPLQRLMASLTKQANEDKRQLEEAHKLYQTAMIIYSDASRQVNKVGSIPLVKELEYDYAGLTSSDLKSLLSVRRWGEYHDVVNSIIRDLQRLMDLAVKYELYEQEDDESEEAAVETDEEKAYRILEVLPTATSEEIKRACDRLRRAFHPDRAKKTEEDVKFFTDKTQWINWALDVLKAARKIS